MFDADLNERQPRFDRLQIAALIGLMIIGLAFVYSATMANDTAQTDAWYDQSWFRQALWYVLGSGAAVAVCLMDYRSICRFSYIFYWLSILSLILVLIPGIGSTHGWGARRWIDLKVFQCQPSEFAKLAFIIALANFLSRPVEELRAARIFYISLGLLALPFLLILKEPDLGSALVLIPTGLAMLYAAGTPKRYLVRLGAVVGVFTALFLVDVLFAPPNWQVKLEDYQKRRLLVYFGKEYPVRPGASQAEVERLRRQQSDDSFNMRQALISVGSGGLMGKGWRQGTQNALGYLPRAVAHNDFIFSVIAEEKGFVGSVLVITLYGVVLFTGIRTASQARDRLGKLLAVGVVTFLFSHVFMNIGMNIRIMPVAGVPLPLLSYGGSSVLVSLVAMGLLQNVCIHRKAY